MEFFGCNKIPLHNSEYFEYLFIPDLKDIEEIMYLVQNTGCTNHVEQS
jgi:hypothetical protein